MNDGRPEVIVHATAVCLDARGALIRGASGSGKSSLALEMMALGASLVADDRVILRRATEGLRVLAPDPTRGLIEARGVGLLRADTVASAGLACVIDLDHDETERLPPFRETVLLDVTVPVFHKVATDSFAAALIQYLRKGREA